MNSIFDTKSKHEEVKSIKRVHAFREGKVTEKELLKSVRDEFHKNGNLLKEVDFKISEPETNDLGFVTNILENRKYGKVNIFSDDVVLFIYDFDVYYDFYEGSNSCNARRVVNENKRFRNLINKIINMEDRQFEFYIIPSFPSIEYAVALGIDHNNSNHVYLESADAKECVRFIRDISGENIKSNHKEFKEIVHENNLFELKRLSTNALVDRKNKCLPKTIQELDDVFKRNNGIDILVNESRPYTYFDQVIQIIYDIVNNL